MTTQNDIHSFNLWWIVDVWLVSHVGQRNYQVTVHFFLQMLAHVVRVLNMIVVCKLSLCEFGQDADPVFTSDSINTDFHAPFFDDVVLLSKTEQLVGFSEADVAHEPREVALAT